MPVPIPASPRDSNPRPLAAVLADVIEGVLHRQLDALADDTERKVLVFDLRDRGVLTDEMTQLAFYWFPNMKAA